jgi:predicted ferric reductase
MTATTRASAPSYRPRTPAGGAARSWWPDAVTAAAAFSLLVVVALWVGNGGLQDLVRLPGQDGLAGGLTSLGRLTGLIAADLLLVQVVLMARVPVVERSFGQDRLARWHRLVGFTSFDLMLAHVVLITLGYAATDHSGLSAGAVVDESVRLVLDYPGMLLALAGTVALCLVVFTSVRAARQRLRYESWHLLHLYAYLGAGLALPHQLWTGTEFTASPAATVYWWSAYGVAAGSVLLYRLGLPLWRSARHRLVVRAVVPEAPGVVSVYLHGRRLDRLPVRAGQFFAWRFLSGPGWTRAHPYSLSAAPRPDQLRITIKELGDGSAAARWLRPGTRVLIEGPYGRLAGPARMAGVAGAAGPAGVAGAAGADRAARGSGRRLTMLASGIGIAPLRALLEELPYRPGDATLIYRARTPADFALRAELDALAGYRGIRVVYLPGPRAAEGAWAPAGTGPDDLLLHRIVPDVAGHDVYVCGPDGWMAAVVRSARRLGVPAGNLHLESFSW